jgi:hypothetical protein
MDAKVRLSRIKNPWESAKEKMTIKSTDFSSFLIAYKAKANNIFETEINEVSSLEEVANLWNGICEFHDETQPSYLSNLINQLISKSVDVSKNAIESARTTEDLKTTHELVRKISNTLVGRIIGAEAMKTMENRLSKCLHELAAKIPIALGADTEHLNNAIISAKSLSDLQNIGVECTKLSNTITAMQDPELDEMRTQDGLDLFQKAMSAISVDGAMEVSCQLLKSKVQEIMRDKAQSTQLAMDNAPEKPKQRQQHYKKIWNQCKEIAQEMQNAQNAYPSEALREAFRSNNPQSPTNTFLSTFIRISEKCEDSPKSFLDAIKKILKLFQAKTTMKTKIETLQSYLQRIDRAFDNINDTLHDLERLINTNKDSEEIAHERDTLIHEIKVQYNQLITAIEALSYESIALPNGGKLDLDIKKLIDYSKLESGTTFHDIAENVRAWESTKKPLPAMQQALFDRIIEILENCDKITSSSTQQAKKLF